MSAELAVRGAVLSALKSDAELMDRLNGLFEFAPARASPPYAVLGECLGSDWGAKDVEGRELRLTISLHDAGETPGRLAPAMARIDPAVRGVADAGEGWRVVTARLVRSRVARVGGREQSGWQAVMEYRLRAVREG